MPHFPQNHKFQQNQKNPAKPFSKFWLTLRRLARMLVRAVENLFDLADVVFRHAHFALS